MPLRCGRETCFFWNEKTRSLMAGISGTNWKVKKQGKEVFLMSNDDQTW